jgi:hypothetical protein
MGPGKFLGFMRRKAKRETSNPPAGKELPKSTSSEVLEPSQQLVIRDRSPRDPPEPQDDDLLIAKEIWDEAYSSLKDYAATKELVDEFETGSNFVSTCHNPVLLSFPQSHQFPQRNTCRDVAPALATLAFYGLMEISVYLLGFGYSHRPGCTAR